MKQSEVIGFLHYPGDVCQDFNLAKWPPFKKKKKKEKEKTLFWQNHDLGERTFEKTH